MNAFTNEQALAFYDSKEWEKWTSEQLVRFQLFQPTLCIPFQVFHQALEEVLDRPVYTHELGLDYEGIVKEYLGERPAPTLDEIIELIPEEKRMIFTIQTPQP